MNDSRVPVPSRSGLCDAIVAQTPDAIVFADRDGVIRLWNLGAEALTADPATLDLKRGATPQPEIEELAQRLRDLGVQARKVEDPKSRSEIYGQMLETCSECHKRQGVEIKPGSPGD